MGVLIVTIGLSLFISAMCSLFEATLYSTRMSAVEVALERGDHPARARRFLRMKQEIATPTAAILILNTVANTAGAAIAGVYAAQLLGIAAVPIFSIGLTLAILFLAEILPKTIGATRWRGVWPHIVWPLAGMEKALWPAIWATQRFSGLLTGGAERPRVTEDEVRATIRLGARSGEISPDETRLLNAVFEFDDMLCRQVMVPRQEVTWFDRDGSLEKWFAVVVSITHYL